MHLSVFVEPTPTGFRATTGGPLGIEAEGKSEQDALDELKAKVSAKLAAGRLVDLPVAAPPHGRVGPDAARFQAAWDRLAAEPLLDDLDRAVAEARKEREAAEEAAEAGGA